MMIMIPSGALRGSAPGSERLDGKAMFEGNICGSKFHRDAAVLLHENTYTTFIICDLDIRRPVTRSDGYLVLCFHLIFMHVTQNKAQTISAVESKTRMQNLTDK